MLKVGEELILAWRNRFLGSLFIKSDKNYFMIAQRMVKFVKVNKNRQTIEVLSETGKLII